MLSHQVWPVQSRSLPHGWQQPATIGPPPAPPAPPVPHGPIEVSQKPLRQSAARLQFWLLAQSAGQLPPQSTSVSSPCTTVSVQLADTHVWVVMSQIIDAHWRPSTHSTQLP